MKLLKVKLETKEKEFFTRITPDEHKQHRFNLLNLRKEIIEDPNKYFALFTELPKLDEWIGRIGKIEDLITSLELHIEANPDDILFYLLLARVYYFKKDYGLAETWLNRVKGRRIIKASTREETILGLLEKDLTFAVLPAEEKKEPASSKILPLKKAPIEEAVEKKAISPEKKEEIIDDKQVNPFKPIAEEVKKILQALPKE